MAEDVVIRAEGLGKSYVIGHQAERERYVALRDVLARNAKNLGRSAMDILRGRPMVDGDTTEAFWALKDVSFEVKRGEVVGIIGRNGAGKSTLLKILSRITEPTEGRVTIRGRVASLLEVGTGFHPELSGRENIYLNGAILGMGRAEIRRKFDEIVTFAEVETFLDTPVKRYSSGMYVRLAFAVAAHLEPEILVVDEVLAVGDAEFQKKCLGKLGEVAGQGRTVLFVSHNISAIQALCNEGLYLENGNLRMAGDLARVISAYRRSGSTPNHFERSAPQGGALSLMSGEVAHLIDWERKGSTILLKLTIKANSPISASIEVRLKDQLGAPVGFASAGTLNRTRMLTFHGSVNSVNVQLDASALASGTYFMSIDLTDPFVSYFDRAEDCLQLTIDAPAHVDDVRPLEQGWGYGSLSFPIVATPSAGG